MNRLLERQIGKLVQIISEFHDSSFNANDDGITEDEAEMVAAKFIKSISYGITGSRILKFLEEIHEQE